MQRTKRIISSIIIGLVLVGMLVVPVLAAAYYADVAVVNTSATSYTMLPAICSLNSKYLAANGYMSATGLDTRVEGGVLPHMLADDKLLFARASAAGSSNLSEFTTGNTPLDSFYILTGYNGYTTVLDNAQLELSSGGAAANFTIDQKGWLDTSYAADKYLVSKAGAAAVSVSSAGGVSASILGKQPIVGGNNNTLNPAATEYNALMGGYGWVPAASSNIVRQCIPASGVISSLYVRLSANVAAGATYSFTLMVNGAPTALTVTIPAGASTGSDLANSVAVAAGQYVTLRCTPTGAPGAPSASWSTLWAGDVMGESICMVNLGCVWNSENNGEIQGVNSGLFLDADEARVQVPVPTNGTFKKLYVKLDVDPGDPAGPDSYSFTLRKNGANTALTCTIAADNTAGNDSVNTVAVSAGDLLSIRIVPLNVPANVPAAAIGMVFVSSTIGESIVVGGSNSSAPTIPATEYFYLCGVVSGSWAAVEANVYSLTQKSTLQKLYVKLTSAPGGATSYTLSIREAGGDTGLTVTVTGANTAGSDTAHTYNSANGDVVDAMVVTTAGAAASYVHYGVVYNSSVTVTVTGVTSDVRRVVTTATGGGTDLLTMSVYNDAGAHVGNSPQQVALGAAVVVDNANNWLINQNNVMPYMEYLKITTAVGGSSEKLWHQPVDYIHGQPYATGTATFTNGSPNVTGAGTAWTSGMNGSMIWSATDLIGHTVSSVTSATTLTLTANYSGAGGAGHNYTMAPRIPDRRTVDGYQDGAITWGANPTGVSVYMDALAAVVGGVGGITTPPPDVAPEIGEPEGMYPGEGEMSGVAITWLYPIVSNMATQTNTPIVMAWLVLCAVFVLLFMAAIHRFVPNMLLTGVGGLAAIGMCVAMAFLPSWFIILAACFIIGLIVMERAPQV